MSTQISTSKKRIILDPPEDWVAILWTVGVCIVVGTGLGLLASYAGSMAPVLP